MAINSEDMELMRKQIMAMESVADIASKVLNRKIFPLIVKAAETKDPRQIRQAIKPIGLKREEEDLVTCLINCFIAHVHW